jgi:hypothetical protein
MDSYPRLTLGSALFRNKANLKLMITKGRWVVGEILKIGKK